MSRRTEKQSFSLDRNRILALLPSAERRLIKPLVELVTLETKDEVNLPGTPIECLHFPIDSAISLMDFQAGGRVVEVAVVGREGCTGFTLVQGYPSSVSRVIVQIGGPTYQIEAARLRPLLAHMPFFRYALTRFSALILRESVISVGCAAFHSVPQRIGRWLLAHLDRTGRSVFPFTHDFLGEQLGVQRATTTEALLKMQRQKLISYGYGEIELINPKAMERICCECFATAKQAIGEYLDDLRDYTGREISW